MQIKDYCKPESRKKILLLSDDLRFPSGVGTMSKEIVFGTAHRFNWVQMGAAIKHPDEGKILDMSEAIANERGLQDANVKIYPTSGYGTPEVLREVMELEKPDAIMMFTDPRYWIWLFEMEREIRTKIPIIYLNIWDDLPYPMYNQAYYESCDGLFAISKQTYNINKQVLGDKAKEKTLRYIPHGVSNIFKPLDPSDVRVQEFRRAFYGENDKVTFRLLYNARNLGRKRVGDLILAWRNFCDLIGEERAKKCELVMHTDIVDNAGTDLHAVREALTDPRYVNIRFIPNRFSTEDMNVMYNTADAVILVSSNEGWGLSVTEALNVGKMIIGSVTGGIQDQMRFEDEAGNWINFTREFPSNNGGRYKKCGKWAEPVFITSRSLVGSPLTPYIFDDKMDVRDIAKAIKNVYDLTPEERAARGMKGREWATGNEAGFTSEKMGERIIEGIEATLASFKLNPRTRFELVKVDKRPSKYIADYNPVEY